LRGYGCGFYSELIFVDSKALKQVRSTWLCKCRLKQELVAIIASHATVLATLPIGKNRPIENRNRVKYILMV